MHIRNRISDIKKLRCNACQDYLKLIIVDEWKNQLYEKTKMAVKYFPSKYKPAYKIMRTKGIENYEIDDMDVTFISEIIHKCPDICPSKVQVRNALEQITEDRNVNGHSNENEECEELYRYAFLALSNLQRFIDTVDEFETDIPDEVRLEYKKRYSIKIVEKQKLIDDERIEQIQISKMIDSDIQKILNGNKDEWLQILSIYNQKYLILEKRQDIYEEFHVRASNAGIKAAHYTAALHFLYVDNFEEAKNRLEKLYRSSEHLDEADAYNIVYLINSLQNKDVNVSHDFSNMIDGLIKQGHHIEKFENGLYRYIPRREWSKKIP